VESLRAFLVHFSESALRVPTVLSPPLARAPDPNRRLNDYSAACAGFHGRSSGSASRFGVRALALAFFDPESQRDS
jgi:hypothetical protein